MAPRRRVRSARADRTTALALAFATAFAVATALLISSLTGRASGADPACDRVAAPAGVDTALGTVLQPFRTVGRLAGALQPGETGCLRGASYRGDVNITRGGTPAAPVRLQSFPGERAEIAGRLVVSAPSVEIAHLKLTGGNAVGASGPVIAASDVLIEDNEITNGHTADCLMIGSPGRKVTGVIVRENDIHDCGRLPSTNRDNGISVAYASGTRIAANRIYDNADRGVQLFPDADGTRVASNVIDGNGEGVMIAGDESATSDDNLVERNLVTNSALRDNVESSWAGDTGTDNVVRANCFSGGARDDGDGGIADLRTGFVLDANLVDDPLYADRAAQGLQPASGQPVPRALRKGARRDLHQGRFHHRLRQRRRHGGQPLRHRRAAGRRAPARTDGLPARGHVRPQRAHRPGRARRRTRDAHELAGRARRGQGPPRGDGQRELRDDLAARPRRDQRGEPAESDDPRRRRELRPQRRDQQPHDDLLHPRIERATAARSAP